jgi:hypothetical protein
VLLMFPVIYWMRQKVDWGGWTWLAFDVIFRQLFLFRRTCLEKSSL